MQFSSWTSVEFTGVEVVAVVGEAGGVEDLAAAVVVEPSVMFLAIPEGWL